MVATSNRGLQNNHKPWCKYPQTTMYISPAKGINLARNDQLLV
ncbi:hypothetical protein SPBRAN_1115 [uncultured Candidatus Thioglobus sp.]|nr:hypothetical protein SPBRAN_1115 [uncultured Candidatus Thioglobus sp.]